MNRNSDKDLWVVVAGVAVMVISIFAGSTWGLMFGFALAVSRIL